MLDISVYEEMPTVERVRTRPRMKKVTAMREKRVRWRMTLDELCWTAGIPATQFDDWASRGILGSRLVASPSGGRGRHITRETAQRTVLVSRLVAAGIHPIAAGHVVQGHKVNDTEPLEAELACGVKIRVERTKLP